MDKYLNLFIKNVERYAKGKSNYEISKLSGVSNSALSLYFSKKRAPSLESIVAISDALKIEPYQLLKDDSEKNIPSDILEMLENQSDTVYETIRTMLNALNAAKSKAVK